MPKKQKKSRKITRIPQRALSLSDKYLFRRTYLDSSLVDQLCDYTKYLMESSLAVMTDTTRARLANTLCRLKNCEFNNIYDYLEVLIETLKNDALSLETALEAMEVHFGRDCVKLANMYGLSEDFDV